MKNIMLFILKPLSFLPALLVMYTIYSFSAQEGIESANLSYTVSYYTVTITSDILDKDLTEAEIDYYVEKIHMPIRKIAHMSIYFILAVSLALPFYVYGLRGFPLLLIVGLICVCFAMLDEYHQSFVAGRGPSKRDVMFDSIGAFFGIIAVRVVCWTALAGSRRRERQERRRRSARY